MPLPFILGAIAAGAGLAGVGSGVHGAVKMKEANDTMKLAERKHEQNLARLEEKNKITSEEMDKLGKMELEILQSFKKFSDIFEQIKNKPNFQELKKNGITLPKYDKEELKKVSVGAEGLLGGIGGAGLGVAGGFAAAGAVMAVGTASTGPAIASLSGVAATHATLAALGGGTIAAGGGGIALGTTLLGASTLGVGLLIGGAIFNLTGNKLADKVDEAWEQVKKEEKQIDDICFYLGDLRLTSAQYYYTLSKVNSLYQKRLNSLACIVTELGHTDWNEFTENEKKITENTVLLVGLLYKMCKVELVLKNEKENERNVINRGGVVKSINEAKTIMKELV